MLENGSLGDTLGIELILQEAIFPATQQQLVATPQFARLCELLEGAHVADQRIKGLTNTISAAPL